MGTFTQTDSAAVSHPMETAAGDAGGSAEIARVALRAAVETNLATAATQLTAIAGSVDGLEGFTDGIETLLGTLSTALTSLQGYVDGLEALVGTTNSTLSTTNTTLSTLDGHVDGLEGFTDGIETLLGTINTSLGTLNTSLGTIDGHVDGLEGFTDGLEGFVDGLETLIGSTNTALATLHTDLAPATPRIAQIGSIATGATSNFSSQTLTKGMTITNCSTGGQSLYITPTGTTPTASNGIVLLPGQSTVPLECTNANAFDIRSSVASGAAFYAGS